MTNPVTEIASNITGFRLARILNDNTLLLQKSLERLTSGLRIVSAGDDPGGLATTVRIGNQIARNGAVQDVLGNVTDFVETQSGFLTTVQTSLDRMSELAVLSQSASATDAQRSQYQIEFNQLQVFISDTGKRTFNSINLWGTSLNTITDADGSSTFTLQAIPFNAISSAGGLATAYDVTATVISTSAAAVTAQAAVSVAIANLGLMTARTSAHVQTLGFYDEILTEASENLTATKDRVLAVDTATEATEFSRLDLLTQSGTTMLGQWNSLRFNLLDLFNL